MGADIYVSIEQRNKETDRWEYLTLYKNDNGHMKAADVYTGRSYDLFGILAGVRNCISPLVNPRGIPDNLSPEVAENWVDGEEDSWHTPTWYDYCELIAYEKYLNQQELYLKTKRELDIINNPDDECYEYDEYYDEYNVSNVFSGFMDSIRYVLDAYDVWYPKPNEIRIIMWFDS